MPVGFTYIRMPVAFACLLHPHARRFQLHPHARLSISVTLAFLFVDFFNVLVFELTVRRFKLSVHCFLNFQSNTMPLHQRFFLK